MFRKIFVLLFFLFLLTTTIKAERIDIGKTNIIAGKEVTLINIGSYGSAILNIENQSKSLIVRRYGKPMFIGSFQINILDWTLEPDGDGYIEYELLKRELRCNTDLDCHDDNICTIDSCDLRTKKCLNTGSSCELNGDCILESTRIDVSNTYCKKNSLSNQKSLNEECNNDYECISNSCSNNRCRGFLVGDPIEKRFSKITGYFVKEGGDRKIKFPILLFIITMLITGVISIIRPKKIRKIIFPLSSFSDNSFKIIGIVLIIIGILIAVFYLT